MKVDKEEDDGNDYIESVGLKATYYNDFVERYFTKYYLNRNTDNEQFVFIHSNGIIMCGIGKNNAITKKNISKVIDLKKPGKITGRRKHGAHFLSENEYVIQIVFDDNSTYNYCPHQKGKLLEINSTLVENPKLLNDFPEKYGFVCIIQLEPKHLEQLREKLENESK